MTDAPRLPAGHTVLTGSPGKHALIFLLVSGMLVFGVLAVLVAARWAPLINLDTSTTASAYHAAPATGWLRRGATAVGSPGTVDVIAVVAVLGLALARRWSPALAVAAARLGELGIESAIKVVVDRPRPVFMQPLAVATGQAFRRDTSPVRRPSTSCCFCWPRHCWCPAGSAWSPWSRLLLLVLAIAGSRLLLGVHYPSDVAAGVGLGSACAAAAVLLTRVRRRTGQRPETLAPLCRLPRAWDHLSARLP